MGERTVLSNEMTVDEFDNGYFYAADLKRFASSIGVKGASAMRKDQLEQVLRHYFETGDLPPATSDRVAHAGERRDSASPLTMDTPIRHYTNDAATKTFLHEEARRIDPDLRRVSGSMYWINRWREQQLADGHPITYGDQVREFVRLNQTVTKAGARLPPIPSARYNNFVTDYLANEPNASREDAIAAWRQLKEMNTPKTYDAWKQATEAF